jgi:DNA-binding response OmpR family regulator
MKEYNILIVEDEWINAQFIQESITKLGYTVISCVRNAEDALEIVNTKNIHVVFMDINLEGSIDGIACAKQINKNKKIPIIYTTAYTDTETINEATDTNLFGYLIKPFDYKDIEAVLNLTIKRNYFNQKVELSKEVPLFKTLSNNHRYYDKTKILFEGDTSIKLTKKESEVFYLLFKNINHIVSIEYLQNIIWEDKDISTSTIREVILRLRKKIPNLDIKTLSGMGYSLKDN